MRIEDAHIIHRRHPGRWVSALVILAIGGWIAYTVATSPNIQWHAVSEYFPSHAIILGLRVTIELTLISEGIGVSLGILLALMRISDNPVLKVFSNLYIWVFRGTPVLVQIIFWYNIALVFPHLWLLGYQVRTNSVVSAFTAAILALGLNEGAYMSEIVRAGILSVPFGQQDAALSVGLSRLQAMRYVVIPQALRVIVPPTGNQLIGMLKTTSLVSVISAQELLTRSQNIYAKNFLVVELLIVASLWYLVLTTIASTGQYYIEKKFAAGATRSHAVDAGLKRSVRRQLLSPFSRLRKGGGVGG